MYNQQSFHTSSYRGNQQGHDQYLHADSQSASSFGGQAVTSQYRGFARPFQPTGQVQSMYSQNAQTQSFGAYGTQQPVNAFHTAAYKGDQAGHDQYLRSDTRAMANSGYSAGAFGASLPQAGYGAQQSAHVYGYGSSQQAGQYGQAQSQSQYGNAYQATSPNAFHTAAYKGNQQGHDQTLRGDSFSPSNYGTASSYGQSAGYGGMTGGAYGATGFASGMSQMGQGTESFHTANYRGNQMGHDSYLHADSRTPSNAGTFGFGGATRF